MATAVIMPRQGQSVESCILSKWHKAQGEGVKTGDLLFSYETDKASFDEEAKVDGILLSHLFDEDDDVPCLAEVCHIGTAEELKNGSSSKEATADTAASSGNAPNAPEPASSGSGAPFQPSAPQGSQELEQPSVISTPSETDGKRAVSPRARRLASQTGVDSALAVPTGPDGRVLERDIAALAEAGVRMTPTAAAMGADSSGVDGTGLGGRVTQDDLLAQMQEQKPNQGEESADMLPLSTVTQTAGGESDLSGYVDISLPNIRKVIARAMYQSISTSCQLTLQASFDATTLLAMRAVFKGSDKVPAAAGITLTDMVLFAVARTLPAHPDLNAHFLDDRIRRFSHVHLGLAVDTERGLMVPTLMGADRMSLSELSTAAKQVAKACQTGRVSPDLLKGGTFTVTNLGTFGIELFTPVLNTPQTGILGVCNIQTKMRNGKNGLESYPAMGLSLTFDHRALDGAPAARFLQDLTGKLEQFGALLAL